LPCFCPFETGQVGQREKLRGELEDYAIVVTAAEGGAAVCPNFGAFFPPKKSLVFTQNLENKGSEFGNNILAESDSLAHDGGAS
jgi:hypothetical protein